VLLLSFFLFSLNNNLQNGHFRLLELFFSESRHILRSNSLSLSFQSVQNSVGRDFLSLRNLDLELINLNSNLSIKSSEFLFTTFSNELLDLGLNFLEHNVVTVSSLLNCDQNYSDSVVQGGDLNLNSLLELLNQNSLFNSQLSQENSLVLSFQFGNIFTQSHSLLFSPLNNFLVVLLDLLEGSLSNNTDLGVHFLSQSLNSLNDSLSNSSRDNLLLRRRLDLLVKLFNSSSQILS
jgi:hypothetical protein